MQPSINIDKELAVKTRKTMMRELKRPHLVDPIAIPPMSVGPGTREVNSVQIKKRLEEGHESFRAVARVLREKVSMKIAPRIIRALMDPGAELNLIRQELLNINSCEERRLKVHAREQVQIILMNNAVEIGRVKEAVYLSFSLDGADESQQVFHEWFYVWDKMSEEMILGSSFCKEHTFTNFHTRLMPWDEELSSTRSKTQPKRTRDLEQIDVVVDEDKAPYERHTGEPLLPNPLTWDEDDDLVPKHRACSKSNANEPLADAETAGAECDTAKFNEDDLSHERDDHDVPKNWIAENVMKHIALIIELAHVDLIEFGHHDKDVEYHGVVHGGQLFVRAVASLIEQFAGMAA